MMEWILVMMLATDAGVEMEYEAQFKSEYLCKATATTFNGFVTEFEEEDKAWVCIKAKEV